MLEGCSPASPPSARAHSGLGPDQAHASARAVEMHLVLRGEQCRDVIVAKEIGRAMRSVEHSNLPVRGSVPGAQWLSKSAESSKPSVFSAICSTSPAFSAPVAWPPNLPSVNVAREPRIVRRIEAAAHGEIAALARALDVADRKRLTRPDSTGEPCCDRDAVELRRHLRTGKTR